MLPGHDSSVTTRDPPMNDNDVTAPAQADVARAPAEDVGTGDLTAGLIDPCPPRPRPHPGARRGRDLRRPWAKAALRRWTPPCRSPGMCRRASVAPRPGGAGAEGNARALLSAERTALNFLQLLSAVATKTRTYVDVVAGTRAHIVDTRKTIPACAWRKSMLCAWAAAPTTASACTTRCSSKKTTLPQPVA